MKKVFSLLMILAFVMGGRAQNDAEKPNKKVKTPEITFENKTITVESNAVNDRVVLKIVGNVNPKPTEAAPENNSGAPKVNN